MSRLIVKNLPKKVSNLCRLILREDFGKTTYKILTYLFQVTEKRIKDLFGEKGTVTDVQLKYTEDGKFRRFAFVGYKTEEEAAEALNFFNNTCIDTSRIAVEHCAGLGKICYVINHYSLYLQCVFP